MRNTKDQKPCLISSVVGSSSSNIDTMAGLMGKQNLSALSFEPLERDFQYLIVNFLFLAGIVVGDYVNDLVEVNPMTVVQDDNAIGMSVNVTVTHLSSVLATFGADLDLCDGCSAGLV